MTPEKFNYYATGANSCNSSASLQMSTFTTGLTNYCIIWEFEIYMCSFEVLYSDYGNCISGLWQSELSSIYSMLEKKTCWKLGFYGKWSNGYEGTRNWDFYCAVQYMYPKSLESLTNSSIC